MSEMPHHEMMQRLKQKCDCITILVGELMKQWADQALVVEVTESDQVYEKDKQLAVVIGYLQKAQKALTQWRVRTGK